MTYKSAFDPENDPVVYTTDYGLEIRYAKAFTNSNLAGYTYFTMGKYNGIDVNWVIIGYDPSLGDLVGNYSGEVNKNPTQGKNNQLTTIDNSPAGTAILKDIFAISEVATPNYEIGEQRILCLCEGSFENIIFGNNNNYINSNLFVKMESLYETELNFPTNFKDLICETQLNTYNINNLTQKLFPLACKTASSNQTFCVETYLQTDELRKSVLLYSNKDIDNPDYWLRSQAPNSSIYIVYSNGSIHYEYGYVSNTVGVRPAFVLQL